VSPAAAAAPRAQLTADWLDAGPVSIAWHLEREGLRAPSTSTIRRILHQAGLIRPELRKPPRSSYTRFQASRPNEMWQSDFTHSRLLAGSDVEILNCPPTAGSCSAFTATPTPRRSDQGLAPNA
jgi:transposase InsO family protein